MKTSLITVTFAGENLADAVRRLEMKPRVRPHSGVAVPPEFLDELADMPKGGLPEDF